MPRQRPSFDEWMRTIDARIRAVCGLTSEDLPDCPYAVWHEEGIPAATAARKALKNAGA